MDNNDIHQVSKSIDESRSLQVSERDDLYNIGPMQELQEFKQTSAKPKPKLALHLYKDSGPK